MTAEDQNKLTGYLLLANGIITAIGASIIVVYFTVFLVEALYSGNAINQMISMLFILLEIVIVVVGIILVVPQLLGGWFLVRKRASGRSWGIAASICAVFCFPIGTIIGIYAVWSLSSEESKGLYPIKNR